MNMTPRRAAMILTYDWIMTGGYSPHYMSTEDMNEKLDGWEYNVTEKRRIEIIEHADKLTEPLKKRLQNAIQDMGGII